MDIKVREETAMPLEQTLCEICQKQFSSYHCPRCNLRYCSLVCYRDLEHADCSEKFYKQSVTEEIENQTVNKESKQKMLQLLKRLEQENEEEEEEREEDAAADRLSALFQDLDIDTADAQELWRRLPRQEQAEFESLVGRLEETWSTLDVPEYLPWWRLDLPKIRALDAQDGPVPEPKERPNFKVPFRPHLVLSLVHLLMVYSYLLRHTLGDCEDTQAVLATVQALSGHLLFSSVPCPFGRLDDVLSDTVERILQRQSTPHAARTRYKLKQLFLQDLLLLLPHAQEAILDLWQILHTVQPRTRALSLALHKLYFHGAFAADLAIDPVQAALRDCLHRVDLDQQDFERDTAAAKQAMLQLPKIQLLE